MLLNKRHSSRVLNSVKPQAACCLTSAYHSVLQVVTLRHSTCCITSASQVQQIHLKNQATCCLTRAIVSCCLTRLIQITVLLNKGLLCRIKTLITTTKTSSNYEPSKHTSVYIKPGSKRRHRRRPGQVKHEQQNTTTTLHQA